MLDDIFVTLKQNHNFRALPHLRHENCFVYKEGKKLLNLASNDYLALSYDKNLKEEFLDNLKEEYKYFSSSSSRSLSGNFEIYDEFEEYLKIQFQGFEVLHFNSGYHLNLSCITALASIPKTLFLADKFIHASMIDGLLLGKAHFFRFKHKDVKALENLIQIHYDKYDNIIILSEALFSMDGDFSDFKALCALKKRYKKIKLYIDEAHSIGCFNDDGLGLIKYLGLYKEIDFLVFTFGKAVASVGACIITHKEFKDFFINKARAFIYSTALPPINVAFTLFIFQKMKEFEDKRQKLQNLAHFFKEKLMQKKYEILGDAYIVSLILNDNLKALEFSQTLENQGFFAPAIKEPTVPKDTARIRFSLHAGLEFDDIERIVNIL